jgi:hypothetical protein
MLRRIILAALSTAILAMSALWVRTYSIDDEVTFCYPKDNAITFESLRGDVCIAEYRTSVTGWSIDHRATAATNPNNSFQIAYAVSGARLEILALWPPLLVCWIAFYLLWARRKHPAGHCPNCGYDIRATPERCPECGTTPLKLIEISGCRATQFRDHL